MNMGPGSPESLCIKVVKKWLSFISLRTAIPATKLKFRDIEKLRYKLTALQSHLCFNETCLNNNLLPTYTNIYIYIYILRCLEFELFSIFDFK